MPATATPTKRAFTAGDSIGYSHKFLKSIGGDYDTASRRGVVAASTLPGDLGVNFIHVQWRDESEPKLVHRLNIAKIGSLAFCE